MHPLNFTSALTAALVLFSARPIFAEEETPSRSHATISPDRRWENRCDEGFWSSIVKAGTNEMVLDLSNSIDVPYCQGDEIIWAPDSKRFAFNHSPSHIPHTTYQLTVFYELRDEKWVLLPSPIDLSAHNPLAQLAKRLPKAAHDSSHWMSDPRLVLKVKEWTDERTAVLYLYAADGAPTQKSAAAFLFTVKFGAEGKWEVVRPRQLSLKEIARENSGSG